jgi:hypothetical protein
VPWRILIDEYARRLGVAVPARKRSVLSMLFHLGDKRYLLLLSFSRFGAHFPDDLLHETIPHEHGIPWQAGVAEAVAGYLETEGDPDSSVPKYPLDG